MNTASCLDDVQREYFHILAYGEPGSGKTWLAASAWKPQLIALFDTLGNARPYFEGLYVREITDPKHKTYVNLPPLSEIPTYDCFADAEATQLVRRIWHFSSTDPKNPIGYNQFEAKIATIPSECQAIGAKFFILDSLLTYTMATKRKVEATIKLTGDFDEMLIAREMTPLIEDMCFLLNGLRLNVTLCAHVSNAPQNTVTPERKVIKKLSDTVVTAPGRVGRNIRGWFSDVWYCYRTDDGIPMVQLTTKEGHIAKNTVAASEDMPNDFEAIIKSRKAINWIA